MTDTAFLVALLVPCLVIAIVCHEVAHGYAAQLLGDPTASRQGRLTLNPLRHVDPVGTLLVPGALALAGGPVFGWAKPVPVNKYRLRNPRLGMMAVAAAGPGINFVLALLGAVALGAAMAALGPGVMEDGNALGTALSLFLLINIFLGLFNLLPIPPFDGSHIVGGLLPQRVQPYWERLQAAGIVLLLGLIGYSWMFGTHWVADTFLSPVEWALGLCLRLAGWIAGAG